MIVMNRLLNYLFAFSFLLSALLVLFFALFRQQSFALHTHKKRIVCSTTFIADAVHSIAKDHVIIDCLMGAGVDPHLYRARESDIHKLAAADLIIYNGLHLEGKMSEIFANMQNFFEKKIITMSDALTADELMMVAENIYDPHIWHNVQLWKQCVLYMSEALVQADPTNAANFQKNSYEYAKILDQLDIFVKEQIGRLSAGQRILITAHDAFSYFGKAYGITVVGLQGVSTEAQVGTKDIQNLADYIVLHKIPALFVESSIPERTLTAVQQAVGSRGFSVEWGEQLYSDALGLKDSDAKTYEEMIRHNVNAIVKALLT